MSAVTRRSSFATALVVALVACAVCCCALCAPIRHAYAAASSESQAADSGKTAASSSAATGANAKGKPSSVVLYRYGWSDGKYRTAKRASTAKYDVTGDGVADSVMLKLTPYESAAGLASGLASGLTIQVNGTEAYVLEEGEAPYDQFKVVLVTLANNRPYLFVSAFDTLGGAFQAVLGYADERFTKIVGNDLMLKSGVSDSSIGSVLPSGNRIIVQYEFVSNVTGVSRTSFIYQYANGKLKRASNTTSALRFVTKSDGSFTKQPRKAARAFTAYTSAKLSKKAFTVAAGKSVRPIALRLSGGDLLYKIQYGEKTGWVKCPDGASGSMLLSGVYGAVPLKHSVPAYRSAKKYSAATLQKYDNHALYLARNEVYARHGMVFSSAELDAYFEQKSWYVPVEGATIKLSKAEAANVALMLSIEKHRNSAYVS